MKESSPVERQLELRLGAWIRIHERLAEEALRREQEIVVMRPAEGPAA